MSIIEGVGDEVTKFLIFIVSTVIIYLAWRSTNVRDERIISRATVVIIERNRLRIQQERSTAAHHQLSKIISTNKSYKTL